MFTFNINSIFIILVCIWLLISNILLQMEIKKLKDKMNSDINSLHIRLNNMNYSISPLYSRMQTIEDRISYLYGRLR